jgi:DNA-binding NarL/FixJ family response regulator
MNTIEGMIRVVLADDQALVRTGFKVLLNPAPDIDVVGEAANGQQAIECARATRADVILMDVRMPVLDGLEATRRIAADDDLAGVRIVILTTYESDEYLIEALRAGASGFLTKDVDTDEVLRAIRAVAAGDALLSPRMTRRLISNVSTGPSKIHTPPASLAELTAREREVVVLAAHGLSNDEIAGKLFLSPLTVKTHISRAMTKLQVRDRAGLVVLAYESGLVVPGQD